jgi:O-antigen/teichoic acid export membrane protein
MQKRIEAVLLPLSTQFHRVAGWFQDDVFRRLFVNSGKLLSARTIAAVIGLAVTVLTARALGPEKYGILALVVVYVSTISTLVTFNAWQAIIKYGAEAQQAKDLIGLQQLIRFGFALDVSSGIIGTILAIALSELVINLLSWEQSIQGLLIVYSPLILFTLGGTPTGVLRLFDRFDLLSYAAVIAALIKLAGVFWCLLTGQDLFGFILVYLLTGITAQLYLIAVALWVIKMNGLSSFFFAPLRGFRRRFPGIIDYVWTTNFQSSVRMVSRQVDEFIIAAFTTPTDLGLYKIAKQFSQVLVMATDPLYQSIYPELSRLWAANNILRFRSLIKRSTFLVANVALIGWLIFVVFGQQIILITVGAIYYDSYWLTVWYMLAVVIAIITYSFQPAMLAIGLPRESFKIQVIATIVYLLTLIPLVGWWFGVVGAAIGYIIYYIVWSSLMFYSIRRHI